MNLPTTAARTLSLLALSWLCVPSATPVAADEEPGCVHDDALSSAAAELLLQGRGADQVALTHAVRAAGSDAVLVHALFLPTEDSAKVASWLAGQKARADAALICGDAQGSAGRLLIASARGGSLLPLTNKSAVVRGALAVGFDRAELVISDASGTLTRVGVLPEALKQGVPIGEDVVRPAKVQLLAHGPSGPRPVAERVLPSSSSAADDEPAPTELQHEANIVKPLAWLAELRELHDVMPLRDNRLLTGVAQAHARAVCAQGRIAHELSRGQDPQVRLRQAGIEARLVGETIARAADANVALAQLEQSPSHRLTLLERRFTDVGFGEAHDDAGKTCVVVLLAAFPRYAGH